MSDKEKKKEIQTYLYIPSSILQNSQLTPIDKLVLSEIHYLDWIGSKRGCWETNKNIANFLDVSESSVSNSIQKLDDLKLIGYSGEYRNRLLTSKIPSNYPIKNSETTTSKVENTLLKSKRYPIKNSETGLLKSGLVSENLDVVSENLIALDNKDNNRLEKDNSRKDQTSTSLQSHLIGKLIDSLTKWKLVGKDFNPNSKQISQLKLAAQKMLDFYKDRTCQDNNVWFEDLYDCIDQNYWGKGDTVSISNLCSDYLWDILMPQWLRNCANE